MKKTLLSLTLLTSTLAIAPAFAADAPAAPAPVAAVNLATDEAKLSYAFGLNMGANLRTNKIAIDPSILLKGLNDGLSGTAPAMTPAQIQETMTKFQKTMMAKQEEQFKADASKNAQEGAAFLKANAAKPGVKSLENGNIQYRIITEGKGVVPKATDSIMLTYEGKLVNGKVFDSTANNGNKPVTLPIKQTIPGMQKVLTMMPVGSTWEVVIASKEAYGERGVPMSPIGPNETLIFNLTVTGIAPATAAAPAAAPAADK